MRSLRPTLLIQERRRAGECPPGNWDRKRSERPPTDHLEARRPQGVRSSAGRVGDVSIGQDQGHEGWCYHAREGAGCPRSCSPMCDVPNDPPGKEGGPDGALEILRAVQREVGGVVEAKVSGCGDQGQSSRSRGEGRETAVGV